MVNSSASGTAADDLDLLALNEILIDLIRCVLVPADDDGRCIDIKKQHRLPQPHAREDIFLHGEVPSSIVIFVGNRYHNLKIKNKK